jgi:hypothetical protein
VYRTKENQFLFICQLPPTAGPGRTRLNCQLPGRSFYEQLPPTLLSTPCWLVVMARSMGLHSPSVKASTYARRTILGVTPGPRDRSGTNTLQMEPARHPLRDLAADPRLRARPDRRWRQRERCERKRTQWSWRTEREGWKDHGEPEVQQRWAGKRK